jgi:flagellar hook-associated protein 3 FlgL
MSVLPIGISRVSDLMQSTITTDQITGEQTQLLQLQNELSTGQAISTPSDNPSASAIIIQLQQSLNVQQTYNDTINSANSQLAQTDTSLGNLTTLLQQAEQIASADVGSDVSATQRQSDITVVQSLYNQAQAIANQQFNGQYLFGGATGTTQPFVSTNGVMQYVGSTQTLQNTINTGISESFQTSGAQVFGALASGANGPISVGRATPVCSSGHSL